MARESNMVSSSSSAAEAGFYYSENSNLQNLFTNQIPPSFGSNPVEIFNLTTGIENMMTFSSKNLHHHHHHHHHQEIEVPSSSSALKNMMTESTEFTAVVGGWGQPPPSSEENNNRYEEEIVEDHDTSLRCVFPCEGNERPSQGLSLSLSSSNPSSIGLQSFELRQQRTNHQIFHQHQEQEEEEEETTAQIFQLRNSRYLVPTQELLYEFCSLGVMNKFHQNDSPKQKFMGNNTNNDNDNDNGGAGSSSRKDSLLSLDFMELQKRKTKLFSMLDEVERRYKHYCEQMKAVVSSFEAVAGRGAATVYSALASKAMSRHFRSLKDGIVSQIQATKRAMGEKDPVAPGTTRGETPRLRVIDQAIRQQRAFQQISLMESHPWRPQRGLPERSVSVLRAWLFEHFLHPYPSDVDKHILARQTGLSRSQVSNWFINARVRLWKPMVEEMYLEETKEREVNHNHNYNNNVTSSDGLPDSDDVNVRSNQNRPSIQTRLEDQKPTPDQLLRIDSECLSSIITNSEKNNSRSTKTRQNHHHHDVHNQGFGRVTTDTFGTVELDFSSYNHHSGSGLSYPNNTASNANNSQYFGGGSGGVSLTLGLQQHAGENGVSIAFSSGSQSSLFYTRDQMEECQPIQYSLLEGESQTLPYRNLMGAQLLHDLAG